MRIVFLTHGTLGDLLPIISLASASRTFLISKEIDIECYIVTHMITYHKEAVKLAEISEVKLVSIGEDYNVIKEEVERKLNSLPTENAVIPERWKEMWSTYFFCKRLNPAGIVFSLFACEGWFIAESLGIPSVAVSPFLQNRLPPTKFKNQLKKNYPVLYHCLHCSSSGKESKNQVLKIFVDETTGTEARVHLCGFWPTSDVLTTEVFLKYFTEDLVKDWNEILKFLKKWEGNVVFVNFGSMDKLGMFDGSTVENLVTLICRAAEHTNSRLLFSVNTKNTYETIQRVASENLFRDILVTESFLPHHLVLPFCKVIVHHGGSGTTHTAVTWGLPQIISPLIFDQSYWADRMEWLGIGVNVGHPSKLTQNVFNSALRRCCSQTTKDVIKMYCEMVKSENGIRAALSVAMEILVPHCSKT